MLDGVNRFLNLSNEKKGEILSCIMGKNIKAKDNHEKK